MTLRSPYQDQLDRIEVTERSVTLDGAATAFWEYGDTAAPPERTIVFVHGFRGDHHGLEPIVAHLPGYRIIAPDLPGFGVSDPLRAGHTLGDFTAWLGAFVAALELPAPPVILGHSFGSIVVAAAVAGGLEVRETILVNPIAAPALSGPRGILTRLAVFYYWASRVLPERVGFALLKSGLITRIMSNAMSKTRDRELLAWIHDQHDRYYSLFATRQSVMEAFTTSVSNDVSHFAGELRGRVLMIVAERDDITPVAAQRALAASLADARIEVIPSVGHLVHYETPAEAAALIRDELEDAPAA